MSRTYNKNIFVSGVKIRKPFLDQLVDISQDGVVLNDTEIKEQVDTIMFEVIICYCTLCLNLSEKKVFQQGSCAAKKAA